MRARQMHNLCIEIYKILANMNLPFMWGLFERSSSSYSTRRPQDLMVPRVNQTLFGSRSIRFEGARLWNCLPQNIKSVDNLYIENWVGPYCGCRYCLFAERTNQHTFVINTLSPLSMLLSMLISLKLFIFVNVLSTLSK